jgi:thiol-disulfide isomerase/thioredoxin
MKTKTTLILCFYLISQLTSAQLPKASSGQITLKGKVTNAKEKSWDFSQSGFIANKTRTIVLNSDGSFNKSFKIDGFQDLYLYLNNDAITIYVQPDDTIELEWDDKDFNRTFKIGSPSASRAKDLQINLLQYTSFRKPYLDLQRRLGQNRTAADSLKLQWINNVYNQELKAILGDPSHLTVSTERFVNQVYFNYAKLLLMNKLLPKYSLVVEEAVLNPDNNKLVKQIIPGTAHYKLLDDKTFNECTRYRDFLFDYIRFGNSLFSSYKTNNLYTQKTEIAPFQPGLKDYYNGMANISLYPIRDWFITKAIINSFSVYSYEESETALLDFLPKCKTIVYKDTLVSFYAMVKKFKSGNPAPPFTLKDEQGKPVSLKDFSGKLVYIDFWGVGCGPCRYEIANYVPKLHEKYVGKDIVFINICVDVDEKTWKKTLTEIKLEGVNLIAEGWTNNPVCKDYNINGIPHYLLLDREGKIINANMARPSQIMTGQNSDIDKLLQLK